MEYEVTGLTELPLNLGDNYVAGTYQDFKVTRESDGETIVSNKPQKLEGGCGSGPIVVGNKGGAAKMTCGLTGTFTYESCTGPQTIDRANLQPNYYTHTSPTYNPGCIAFRNT